MTQWSITTRPAVPADASFILACTNEAFMADAFFKTKEHHNRYTLADVQAMLVAPNSNFVVAEITDHDQHDSAHCCGSLYVKWAHHAQTNVVVGQFSSVSVLLEFERRGVGSHLIQAAELLVATHAKHLSSTPRMEISVVSARKDLFGFYERKGYRVTGSPVENPEFSLMLNDTHQHVHLVAMEKVLQLHDEGPAAM
ncbi:hypothetical protein DYB32_005522 [Aphanomyces invadans]|uniref:N-acetyltransferase domain-containing protein n=1 Tax=Aphanomyces invadans TaxID=157072 RepID=A0A418AUC2_9STRA|nr:hypothetical protein DYB32_005522 [Aphanomyces invadans]